MVDKAERKLAQIQTEMVRANKLLETLEASQTRLQGLYEEYRVRVNGAEALSHGMQDALNHRQFMAQLVALSQRVEQDIARAKYSLEGLSQQMAQAECERLKMKTLDEKEQLAFELHARKREQRSMDELGVSQFNRIGLS
ncbi:MAG: flagellar FliJ family protein [Bacteroidota bacterium]